MKRLLSALLLLCSPGCGPAALIHDAYIGPISPAGYVHPLVTGENFRVDELGPIADETDDALLRPFPRDFLRRMCDFVPLVYGLEFAVAGFSLIIEKDARSGAVPADEQRAKIQAGASVREVLAAFGPPMQWIKRETGSVMVYKGDVGHDVDFHLGVPPGVSDFIPIPGISSITFTYAYKRRTPKKAILFFDGQDALRSIAWSDDK